MDSNVHTVQFSSPSSTEPATLSVGTISPEMSQLSGQVGAILSPEQTSLLGQEPINSVGISPVEISPFRPPTSVSAYTIDVEFENVKTNPAPRLEGVVIRITGSLKTNPKLKAVVNNQVIIKVLHFS